jgi:hypothetical protein
VSVLTSSASLEIVSVSVSVHDHDDDHVYVGGQSIISIILAGAIKLRACWAAGS